MAIFGQIAKLSPLPVLVRHLNIRLIRCLPQSLEDTRMPLDWYRRFGFGTTLVSVTKGKLFVLLFFDHHLGY